MKMNQVISVIFFCVVFVVDVFSLDYTLYRDEHYTVPRNNPAYLMTLGHSRALVRNGNTWSLALGPLNRIPLSQNIYNKIIEARNSGDYFIVFYERRGNYIDIVDYTGTNDPDLIRRDREGQMRFLEAVSRGYSFVITDILPYSEILSGISVEMKTILLNEENSNPGPRIYNAFVNGYMQGARNYINQRINEIQTARSQAEAIRFAAENRENLLSNATVSGGYKPLIRHYWEGNPFDSSSYTLTYEDFSQYDKVVIFGRIINNEIVCWWPLSRWPYTRTVFRLSNPEEGAKFETDWNNLPGDGSDYPAILFLTKTGDMAYSLDRYEFYYDLIKNSLPPYPSLVTEITESWILNNADGR